MITVHRNPNPVFDPSKPWEVLDDGFCYDRYKTEAEAQAIAVTLVGRNDFELRLELDFNEFVDSMVERYPKFTEDEIRKHIKELNSTY